VPGNAISTIASPKDARKVMRSASDAFEAKG
jgi:hypothetical protein